MSTPWDYFSNKEEDTYGQTILTNGDAETGDKTGWTYTDTDVVIGGVGVYGSFVFKIADSGYIYQIVEPEFTPPDIDVYAFCYIAPYVGNYDADVWVYIRYTDLTEDKYTLPINAALNDDYEGSTESQTVNWFLVREKLIIPEGKTIDDIIIRVRNDSGQDLYVDNIALRLNNNIPVSRGAETNETLIDKYGINPIYLDYFKNMVYNSSFERYEDATPADATPTEDPVDWTGTGTTTENSSFFGSRSCQLAASEYVETSQTINPSNYGNELTRVSFYRKLGQMKLEVYDIDNADYFTLTDIDGNTGSSITFDENSNWQNSNVSAQFDPTEHGSCTSLKIVVTNVHASETGYIDAVMLQPDYTGKWPQIYKDGPRSSEQSFVISTSAPSTDKLWVDISAGASSGVLKYYDKVGSSWVSL
jgi:hypothetical protein